MSDDRPILLTLTARHFDKRQGFAHAVPLRHPEVLRRIDGRSAITLWIGGHPVRRGAASVQEVAEHGEGRCHLNLPYETSSMPRDQWCGMLWMSLPDNSDPRDRSDGVVVELEPAKSTAPTRGVEGGGPLLIVGAQRTGTTALLTALDTATSLRSPQDVCMHRWHTLEGFFTIQSMRHWLTHPFVSPLGTDGEHVRFRTGMFDDSAFASAMLDSLGDHLAQCGALLTGGSRRWVEKCPGWETSSAGPLFVSLFRSARVLYMTRDPVSCAMSIARMEGSLEKKLESEASLRSIARNSSVWVVSHLVWRRYARTRLQSHQMLEVPFRLFQQDPAQVVPSIATTLGLTTDERDRMLESLGRLPTRKHPIAASEIDSGIPSLIRRLCRTEAAHWGYDLAPCEPIEPQLLDEACSQFRIQLERMLGWYGIRGEVARALCDSNVGGASDSHETAIEPALPPPGPLLAARLARQRG